MSRKSGNQCQCVPGQNTFKYTPSLQTGRWTSPEKEEYTQGHEYCQMLGSNRAVMAKSMSPRQSAWLLVMKSIPPLSTPVSHYAILDPPRPETSSVRAGWTRTIYEIAVINLHFLIFFKKDFLKKKMSISIENKFKMCFFTKEK